jgi:hypothetical protein
MTYVPTPEGTTGSLPIIAPTQGRRRVADAAPYGPPSWLPLILTTVSVAAAWFAIYVFLTYRDLDSFVLMAVALVYAAVAFGFDVWAAVTAHREKADD